MMRQGEAVIPGEQPKAAGKGDGAPKPEGKRAALATLLDALSDIPAEEERTNPWDIPSDDPHDEVTHARRDSDGSGKRKRSGKA